MSHRSRALLGWVVALAVGAVWWFVGAPFVMEAGSYHVGATLGALILVALALHVRALQRYHRIVRHTQDAEEAGTVDSRFTRYARNQRFRYVVRVLEAIHALAVAVLAILTVSHPSLAYNENYSKFVLTYFYGSIALTAVLTWRDLHVLSLQQKDPT